MIPREAQQKSSRAWLGPLLGLALGWALVLALAACAHGPFAGRAEPRWIEVRNETGADLAYVYLSGHTRHGAAGPRYASLSPVPRGATQRAGRPTDPPALPAQAMVRFQVENGPEISAVVDLKPVLGQAGADPGQTLVFRIRPDRSVEALLE